LTKGIKLGVTYALFNPRGDHHEIRFLTRRAALAADIGNGGGGLQPLDHPCNTNAFKRGRTDQQNSERRGSAEDNTAARNALGGPRVWSTAIKGRQGAHLNNHVRSTGGDQFQGSLFYTHYKGKMAAGDDENMLAMTA